MLPKYCRTQLLIGYWNRENCKYWILFLFIFWVCLPEVRLSHICVFLYERSGNTRTDFSHSVWDFILFISLSIWGFNNCVAWLFIWRVIVYKHSWIVACKIVLLVRAWFYINLFLLHREETFSMAPLWARFLWVYLCHWNNFWVNFCWWWSEFNWRKRLLRRVLFLRWKAFFSRRF